MCKGEQAGASGFVKAPEHFFPLCDSGWQLLKGHVHAHILLRALPSLLRFNLGLLGVLSVHMNVVLYDTLCLF